MGDQTRDQGVEGIVQHNFATGERSMCCVYPLQDDPVGATNLRVFLGSNKRLGRASFLAYVLVRERGSLWSRIHPSPPGLDAFQVS